MPNNDSKLSNSYVIGNKLSEKLRKNIWIPSEIYLDPQKGNRTKRAVITAKCKCFSLASISAIESTAQMLIQAKCQVFASSPWGRFIGNGARHGKSNWLKKIDMAETPVCKIIEVHNNKDA